jgi:hypothetical protein
MAMLIYFLEILLCNLMVAACLEIVTYSSPKLKMQIGSAPFGRTVLLALEKELSAFRDA